MSASRYSVEPSSLPDSLRQQIELDWATQARKELGNPLINVLAIWGFSTILGAAVCYFLKLSFASPVFWVFHLGGAMIAGIAYWKIRTAYAEVDRRIATMRGVLTAIRHQLDLNGPHQFARHEHGVIVLVPLDETRTFCIDISSVADDPMDLPVNAALDAGQILSQWTWYQIEGLTLPSGFSMSGEPVRPVLREEFASVDEWGDFVDRLGEEVFSGAHIVHRNFTHLTASSHRG